MFPYAHIYVRLNGSMGGNNVTNTEKWSSGLRFGVIGGDVPLDPVALQDFVEAVHTAFRAIHQTVPLFTGTNCWLHNVSGARIGPDGKYLPLESQTAWSTQGALPGNGSNTHPWNTALVVSLRTVRPRSYASNGRFYYPMLGGVLETASGRLAPATVEGRLAAFKTCFDACNAAADDYAPGMRLQVISSTGGVAARVTSIRSDTRFDSIERRENAAVAAWSTADLDPA